MSDVVAGPQPFHKVHSFVWDRTRSVRNDFTVQNVEGLDPASLVVAVDCFEVIARFHIIAMHEFARPGVPDQDFVAHNEREQLNKTLTSLMELYDICAARGISCENEGEFGAYQLVLYLNNERVRCDAATLDSRRPRPVKHQALSAALRLWDLVSRLPGGPRHRPLPRDKAVDPARFGRVFKLLRMSSVPYTLACLAETHFNEVRRSILIALKAAYDGRPDLGSILLDDVADLMGFVDHNEATYFLHGHGVPVRAFDDGSVGVDFADEHVQVRDPTDPLKQPFSEHILAPKLEGRTIVQVLSPSAPPPLPPSSSSFSSSHPPPSSLVPAEPSNTRRSATDDDSNDSLFVGPPPVDSPLETIPSPDIVAASSAFEAPSAFTTAAPSLAAAPSSSSLYSAATVPPFHAPFATSSSFGAPSSFGRPSGFGAPSSFGRPSPFPAPSPFGAPSASSTAAFSNAETTASPFAMSAVAPSPFAALASSDEGLTTTSLFATQPAAPSLFFTQPASRENATTASSFAAQPPVPSVFSSEPAYDGTATTASSFPKQPAAPSLFFSKVANDGTTTTFPPFATRPAAPSLFPSVSASDGGASTTASSFVLQPSVPPPFQPDSVPEGTTTATSPFGLQPIGSSSLGASPSDDATTSARPFATQEAALPLFTITSASDNVSHSPPEDVAPDVSLSVTLSKVGPADEVDHHALPTIIVDSPEEELNRESATEFRRQALMRRYFDRWSSLTGKRMSIRIRYAYRWRTIAEARARIRHGLRSRHRMRQFITESIQRKRKSASTVHDAVIAVGDHPRTMIRKTRNAISVPSSSLTSSAPSSTRMSGLTFENAADDILLDPKRRRIQKPLTTDTRSVNDRTRSRTKKDDRRRIEDDPVVPVSLLRSRIRNSDALRHSEKIPLSSSLPVSTHHTSTTTPFFTSRKKTGIAIGGPLVLSGNPLYSAPHLTPAQRDAARFGVIDTTKSDFWRLKAAGLVALPNGVPQPIKMKESRFVARKRSRGEFISENLDDDDDDRVPPLFEEDGRSGKRLASSTTTTTITPPDQQPFRAISTNDHNGNDNQNDSRGHDENSLEAIIARVHRVNAAMEEGIDFYRSEIEKEHRNRLRLQQQHLQQHHTSHRWIHQQQQ